MSTEQHLAHTLQWSETLCGFPVASSNPTTVVDPDQGLPPIPPGIQWCRTCLSRHPALRPPTSPEPGAPGAVPPGWECVTFDPDRYASVLVARDFAGVVLVTDNVVRLLSDHTIGQGPGTTFLPDLTPVERAVAVTRLRAWADQLETP